MRPWSSCPSPESYRNRRFTNFSGGIKNLVCDPNICETAEEMYRFVSHEIYFTLF